VNAKDQPDEARVEVVVRGRVQGVGYRYFAWTTGHDLGVRGGVANEGDGSVRVVAEGPRSVLETFAGILGTGPASAVVEGVALTWSAAIGGLGDFGIRSGAHRGD
jgi:acylphosphatase